VDGSPLRYNQDDVYLPDLVVCRPELSEPILTHLAAHGVGA
jgi:3'(2'), 5'-bisphosphate nucleotidase